MSDDEARPDDRPSLLRRAWRVLVNEFAPFPQPRPAPSDKVLAEGHLALGVIDAAIEDGPSGEQGSDLLIIKADVPGHGTLRRRVWCPLEQPGAGRQLIGQGITFRHTTDDPDFVNDVLVVRWPGWVEEELKPYVPGSLCERVWMSLATLSGVLAVLGGLAAWVLLLGIVTGGEMFADLPSWFRPDIALATCAAASVAGFFTIGFFDSRAENARARRPGHRGRRGTD